MENDLEIASQELDQTKSYLEQLKIEKENLKKEIIETSDHQIISLSSQKSCVNELMQENISRNGDSVSLYIYIFLCVRFNSLEFLYDFYFRIRMIVVLQILKKIFLKGRFYIWKTKFLR